MIVKQLKNDKLNYATNQFVITTNNGVFFQSYETPCAKYHNDRVYLNKNYFGEEFTGSSKTTNKHLYIWLHDYANYSRSECNTKYIRKAIKDGHINMVTEEELEYTSYL